MLLGTTAQQNTSQDTEPLIIQLLLQQRYAEAYLLMNGQRQVSENSAIYNTALCLYWGGNYHESLKRLESIQFKPQVQSAPEPNDHLYQQISINQKQTNDHLQGITEAYLKNFPGLFHDAVVRLKVDCWSHLGDHARVIALATPIAHKKYQNIIDALTKAQAANG